MTKRELIQPKRNTPNQSLQMKNFSVETSLVVGSDPTQQFPFTRNSNRRRNKVQKFQGKTKMEQGVTFYVSPKAFYCHLLLFLEVQISLKAPSIDWLT
jgi:hypothetical protein